MLNFFWRGNCQGIYIISSEVGGVGLDWVGVPQTDSIVALNKAEVGRGLGFVGLGHRQNNSTRPR